ncbi:hypothetical protein [Hyalangium gracile]|uniref:hypothetical protein n=1 Tax=Hyalangium gracile TaxID=394092 RepID=UPI001CCC8F83|nr:hypothetical protein [Hyalangium gracile]
MSTARLVLCLTVLTSSLGFAQTPEESPSPTSPAPLPPPPLVPAPEKSEPAELEPPPPGESIPYTYRPSTQERSSAKRLLFQTLAGAGTGALAGIAGVFTGFLLVGNDCSDAECAIPVLGSMSLGILLGTPLGVYGVGRAMDGHGKYWASLAGTTLGSLAGITLAVVSASADSDGLVLLSLMLGPIVGAVLGYELSNTSEPPLPGPAVSASSSRAGFQCLPVFSVTRSGGILGGFAGRF